MGLALHGAEAAAIIRERLIALYQPASSGALRLVTWPCAALAIAIKRWTHLVCTAQVSSHACTRTAQRSSNMSKLCRSLVALFGALPIVRAASCPRPLDGMGASCADYAKGAASWQTNDVAVQGADGRVALTFNLS